jgi:murein DD-endopeptidase MepM/ murein hydrolase activator NlpD
MQLVIRLIFIALLVGVLSCAQLTMPNYVPQGEFSTPDEILNSQEVKRQIRVERGPFILRPPVLTLKISRGFKPSGRRKHHGLDIAGRKNDPILASHDGVVIYAGQAFRGYGKLILIEYDRTWATLYAHLTSFEVKTGDSVRVGEIIGRMGKTGRASGVHLHFELLKEKKPIDPLPFLNAKNPVAGIIDLLNYDWSHEIELNAQPVAYFVRH